MHRPRSHDSSGFNQRAPTNSRALSVRVEREPISSTYMSGLVAWLSWRSVTGLAVRLTSSSQAVLADLGLTTMIPRPGAVIALYCFLCSIEYTLTYTAQFGIGYDTVQGVIGWGAAGMNNYPSN